MILLVVVVVIICVCSVPGYGGSKNNKNISIEEMMFFDGIDDD